MHFDPLSLVFGVQSHSIVTFSLSFGVQSHFSCPFMHFRVTIFLSFGVQSHFSYSFRHSMSPSFFSLASRAIVHIPSGTLSHHLFVFSRSESFLLICIIQSHRPRHSYPLALHMLPSWICIYPRFPYLVTLCLSPIRHCPFTSPFSLLMTMSFEFTICIFVVLLSILHLSFSYSSHRVASFRHSFLCSSEWSNCYSSLMWSFESLLETS